MKKLHFYTFVFYVVLFATLYTAPLQARVFSTQEEALKRAVTGATMSVNEITREVRKVLSVFKIMILNL